MACGRRWSITAVTGLVVLAGGGCVAPQRAPDVVVYASGADLESANPLVTIHPLSRQVQRHMLFVPLARYDSALAPEPYGARRWDWSADRRTLTFVLEPSLRWHDGRPTTAHDAAFTLDAARDPATGYMRAGDLDALASARAVDDTTLVLRFRAPQAQFPLVLCELPVLPRHLLGGIPRSAMRGAAFNLHPVGNGPFRFVERVAGQRWRFARNERFPAALGGPPTLAGAVIAVVDEATTKFAALASGEVDVAGVSPTMASLVDRDPSLEVLSYPVLFATALVFNVTRPPFDDARVRRAIALAIDRDRIVDATAAGYATPAGGPAPRENPLALAAVAQRNPATADSLLDAAGWRRRRDGRRVRAGRALEVELLTVGSGDNAVEQLLQADLAERGIRLDIRQVEMGTMLSEARAAEKRFDVLYTGIPGDLSLAYLSAMFDSRQRGGALDYAGHHTRRLDALFARIRASASLEETRGAWHAVQAELLRDMPAAWIYHARGVQGVSTRLRNVHMDLRGELATIADWELTPP
jgi:peptide/nickel transport system substrate-binding protein